MSVIHSRASFCISWWCFVDKNQPLNIISLKYIVTNHVHCIDGVHAGSDKPGNNLRGKATMDALCVACVNMQMSLMSSALRGIA